ncbi:MAG: hypothetical protein V4547_00415 [Bacteroidota bacterium]
MIGLLIFLTIIVFVFIYVLFAPFYLEINTVNGLLRFRFHRLIHAQFFTDENSLFLNLKIAGWEKQIDLLAQKEQKEQKKKSIKRQVKPSTNRFSLKKISAIVKSFKANKFYLSISFNEMMINGIIYPLFHFLSSKTNKRIEINFFHENEIILEVENNFFRIIRAYIKS